MKKLVSRYDYKTTGVTFASPVNIMQVPYDSRDPETPIFVEICVFGISLDASNIAKVRMFFILPMLYYVTGAIAECLPTKNVAIPYNSALFSQMDFTDSISGVSSMQVVPTVNTTDKKLQMELTVPNNSKNWDINVFVNVYKELE